MCLSFTVFTQCCLGLILLGATISGANYGALQYRFYSNTCSNAESIVRKTVFDYINQDIFVAARLLRLHFHDCFVRGCDGSVLLNSTSTNKAEKDANPNLTLGGYNVIDAAKSALEKECPGVVSCADITALAARDAVLYLNNNTATYWEVETGRRDGRVSNASEAAVNLPDNFAGFSELKSNFAATGLNVKDLAVLSGGHTIGVSKCKSFEKRIYEKDGVDPTLNASYIPVLREKCKPGDTKAIVTMVPGPGSITFDTDYYTLVTENKGLFQSDAALLTNKETKDYVYSYSSNESLFFKDFGVSIVKMGRYNVLTGQSGEIRQNCAVVNMANSGAPRNFIWDGYLFLVIFFFLNITI